MRVVKFDVWDTRVPATLILTVEGEDCEKDLGMEIRPGTMVGSSVVIDNVVARDG